MPPSPQMDSVREQRRMKMHKLEQELESATKHVVDLENFAARRQVILNKLQKDYEIPVVASEVTYDAQTERKLDELSHVPWLGKKAIGLQEAATRVKTQALHEMAEQENTQPQAPQLATGPDENEARRALVLSQAKLAETRDDVSELRQELERTRLALGAERQKVQVLEEELRIERSRSMASEVDKHQLEDMLANPSPLELPHEQVQHWKREIAFRDQQIDELRTKLSSSSWRPPAAEASQTSQELVVAVSPLHTPYEEVQHLRRQLEFRDAEIAHLKRVSGLSGLSGMELSSGGESDATRLEVDLSIAKTEVLALRSQLTEQQVLLDDELPHLRNECTDRGIKMVEMEYAIKDARDARTTAEAGLQAAKTVSARQLAEFKKKVEELTGAVGAARKESMGHQSKISQLEREVKGKQEVESRLEAVVKEVGELKEQAERVPELEQSLSEANVRLAKHIKALSSKPSEREAVLQQVEEELAARKDQVSELESQISELEDMLRSAAQVEGEAAAKDARIAELEAAIDGRQASSPGTVISVPADSEALAKRVQVAEAAAKQLAQMVKGIQAENETQRAARDQEWRQAVERMGQELQRKEEQLRQLQESKG